MSQSTYGPEELFAASNALKRRRPDVDPLDVTDKDEWLAAWRRELARPKMVVAPPRDPPSLLPAFLVITVPLCLFWFVVGVAVGARWG